MVTHHAPCLQLTVAPCHPLMATHCHPPMDEFWLLLMATLCPIQAIAIRHPPQVLPAVIRESTVTRKLREPLKNLPTPEEPGRMWMRIHLHHIQCLSRLEEQRLRVSDSSKIRLHPQLHPHNAPQPITPNPPTLPLLHQLPLLQGPAQWPKRRCRPRPRGWTIISTEQWSWRVSRISRAKSRPSELLLLLLQ